MENTDNLFTKTPYGWPLVQDAFLSFVSYAIGQKKYRIEFIEASGHNLESLIPKNPLEAMIDKDTRHTNAILKEFIDWLIINHWGEEGKESKC